MLFLNLEIFSKDKIRMLCLVNRVHSSLQEGGHSRRHTKPRINTGIQNVQK